MYLRLSTRPLDQPSREMTPSLRDDIVKGAYTHGPPPSTNTKICIVFVGALAPVSVADYVLYCSFRDDDGDDDDWV